jgi:hypothetical protein
MLSKTIPILSNGQIVFLPEMENYVKILDELNSSNPNIFASGNYKIKVMS